MSDKAWKRAERSTARLFGAERRPLSGMTHNSHNTGNDDAEHEKLYIETKQSGTIKSPFNAVCKLMQQTIAKAELADKIPVVALRRTGLGDTETYLVVRASDLPRIATEYNPKSS